MVARRHVLMDLVVREPREAVFLGLQDGLGVIGFRHPQAFAEDAARLLGRERRALDAARGRHRRAVHRRSAHACAPTPTWMPRKRAEEAPCAVRMVWLGWPLPQLGVPQISQSLG